ncbi:MAG: NTP transferase domain-containing protein [Bacteroidota bacterium]
MAHQKHAKLSRPSLGQYARNEWAILGTPCGKIKQLAFELVNRMSADYQIAYIDADHKSADQEAETGRDPSSAMTHGAGMELTDKITHARVEFAAMPNEHQQKAWFRSQDLVLINGNHFPGQQQIAIVNPKKPLDRKLHKLTDVGLILLSDGVGELPDFLKAHVKEMGNIPVLSAGDLDGIEAFLRQEMAERLPLIKGLVLAGGRSTRMRQDKGLLKYHGKAQRIYAYEMIEGLGLDAYMSCREDQLSELTDKFRTIPDQFLGLGPFGGILSAFREDPNAAWLVIACDLPFLSSRTLTHLLENRNSSRLATTYQSPHDQWPEPLITLWEPRAYPVLLEFLSRGYSCPRKVLINSEIELLQAPVDKELANVNHPEEYEAAMTSLQKER